MKTKEEQEIIIAKFRVIKNYIEKANVAISSFIWLLANFYDILKLQRFWFDYALELYTSLVLFILMIYSINPNSIPYKVYKHFKIITKIKGRGFLLISISFLFLADKHLLHKYCAILLLISGILCYICEILIPTTKEEILKISEIYESDMKNINQSGNVIISNNSEYNNFINEIHINSNAKEVKIQENIKESNKLNIEDVDVNKFNKINDVDEKIDDNDEKDKNNNQSGNPYDLPDDF